MAKNVNAISNANAALEDVNIEMKKNVNNLVSNLEDVNVNLLLYIGIE